MTKREIIQLILFSLLSCGIYLIYWYYVTAEELNMKDSEDPLLNYVAAFLLGLVTCGIFLIYWQYKFYRKMEKVVQSDVFFISFILCILGLSLVSAAIAQDTMNKMEIE